MYMEIQIFKHEKFGDIRTINKDGEPWFVGKDVASVLGYKSPSVAICENVDSEDKTTFVISEKSPSSTNLVSTPSSFLPSFHRRRSSSVG